MGPPELLELLKKLEASTDAARAALLDSYRRLSAPEMVAEGAASMLCREVLEALVHLDRLYFTARSERIDHEDPSNGTPW